MQTKKEALLAAYKGEPIDFIPNIQSCTNGAVFPGDRYFGPDKTGYDAWGVNWTQLGPDPGIDGSMVTPGTQLFEYFDEWKEHVKFPDLEAMHAADILRGMAANWDRANNVTQVLVLSGGAFERMNQLVGMENALCAFYEYPDEVKEFCDAFCEYRLKCIDLIHEVLHPDVIEMHDDWGTNTNMFFSPEIWREFIKPMEQRYIDRIHSYGMIYNHHSCGYIMQIIPDLVEMGLDCINPLNVSNDVALIKEKYGDKITLMGGVDNQKIDADGCPEEDIRKEARRVIDAYGKTGRYIANYIFGSRRSRDIFLDEVEKYGIEAFMR